MQAKGASADGKWTLEFARKLNTGNSDDTEFDKSRTYKSAVGVHNDTGDMDKASGIVELSFGRQLVIMNLTQEKTLKTFGSLWLMTALTTASAFSQTVNFDDAKPGELPAYWSGTKTGKGDPKWTIEKDDTAPSKPNVLKQSGEATYPLALKNDTSLKDGFVEVKFKAISGKEDQAAGVIWRAKDADNYYICRANALEDNVVLYKTENGKRKSLDIVGRKGGYGVETKVAPQRWHTLRVEFAANRFKVLLNRKHLFDVEDRTFTDSGKVGLWTKADSVTLFDDFAFGTK